MRSLFNRPFLLVCLPVLIGTVQAEPLAIEILPTFKGQPVQLDSLKYRLTKNETISFSRISLLLSDFALESENGNWIELETREVFIDAASHRMNAPLGLMPEGQYRSIRFAVGPGPEANHSNPAQYAADHALNPVLNNLLWDWQSGYIFLALEGRFQTPEKSATGFVLHYANDWNRTWINMPLKLDGDTASMVHMQFDLAALLNTPTPLSFTSDGHITHSRKDDALADRLHKNLPTAFSIKQISTAAPTSKPDTIPSPLYLPAAYTPYPFTLSRNFPIPALPLDNPLTEERVELGRKLFNETALSGDQTLSCASCHKTEYALTDGLALSKGIHNRLGTRNSMPLFNLAWKNEFFWDGRASSLRDQVLQPITNPVEMANDFPTVLDRLNNHPEYPALFETAFSPSEPTPEKIALALEAYLLTLVSDQSKLDQAQKGATQLSAQEQRGMELFFTEYDPRTRQYGADCFHCHGGALFSDQQFHNNGLAQANDSGRFLATGKDSDRYKFSTPSLRNIAQTAPYMHDGRFQTLEEVIEHYTSPLPGTPTLDPNLAKHPETGLQLSDADKQALIAFLHTLSDPNYQ